MVIEIDQEQLEEARNLFEQAANLTEAEKKFRECTEAVGKAIAARDKAAERHKKRIKAAQDAKVRAHAAVSQATQAQHQVRHRFVPRELIVALSQAEARGRELVMEHREQRARVRSLERSMEQLKRRKDIDPDDLRMRLVDLQRSHTEAEAEEASRLTKINEHHPVVDKAGNDVARALEAVYKLAFAPPADSDA